MGRPKLYNFGKYIRYDKVLDVSTCLQCNRKLKGNSTNNIKRHYETVHNIKIGINGNEIRHDFKGNRENRMGQQQRKEVFTKMTKNEFLLKCIGLVTVKGIPFNIFDDEDNFKKIIEPYEKLFEITLTSENIAEKINVASSEIKKIISNIVDKKMVCLKIDIGSRMDEIILGINIQYIEDFKIHTNTLGIIRLKRNHTVRFLKDEIVNCLNEFNIEISQIYSSTTDNGANFLRTSKLFQELQEEILGYLNKEDACLLIFTGNENEDEYEGIHSKLTTILPIVRSAAHTLQLVAHDALQTVKDDIEKCRKAVKMFRAIIRKGECNVSMPPLNNVRRCDSTIDMIQSLVNLRNFTESSNLKNNIDIDWDFTTNFLKAFLPMAIYTKKLQEEQYTIGDFYRDWLCCEVELEELQENGNIYANKLLEAMYRRKEQLLEMNVFLSAIYLDPRLNFENSPFLNEEQRKGAVRHLLQTHETIKRFSQINNETNQHEMDEHENKNTIRSQLLTNTASVSTSNLSFSKLEVKLSSLMEVTTPYLENMQKKLKYLSYNDRVPFSTNILHYWRDNYHKDPELGELAKVALAVPATQVSVERTFNAVSTILTETGSKLSKESVNNILVTKLNEGALKTIFLEDL